MKILFINPNTSDLFTQRIEKIAKQYAHSGTEIIARTATSGPASIESIYDEALSCQGTLETALKEIDHVDGIVIACYSDHPAIAALREVTDIPVLGIAEANMFMACMLGKKFSVVTTNVEWEPLLWDAVCHYGLTERCASIRSTGLPVLALETADSDEIYAKIKEAAQKAIDKDGAEVICLGCAGMSGMDKQLEEDLKVPVLDGVVCALKLLEGMVEYGVGTSKQRSYARPNSKELLNMSAIFSRGYRSNK
jgi:allantoin racemase